MKDRTLTFNFFSSRRVEIVDVETGKCLGEISPEGVEKIKKAFDDVFAHNEAKPTPLNLAEAQLLGFGHASKGYDIESLADSMGMNREEWITLSRIPHLKKSDKDALDEKFNV